MRPNVKPMLFQKETPSALKVPFFPEDYLPLACSGEVRACKGMQGWNAGLECMSGGSSTTATTHGRLYATDLALANPDPVGLAPAPRILWQAGSPWDTQKHSLLHSAAQHSPLPSWHFTPQTHSWIHSSDKTTGFKAWTLLLPALCIIT